MGTLRWKIRTSEAVKAELTRRAEGRGLTAGDIVAELVTGLSEEEKDMVNALFMEARHRLREPEDATGPAARRRREEAARIAALQKKLTNPEG
ncbi:MAG: hypothetical protein KDM81_22465 [Verrucomicrobiae bacterium]|nr:hypothetical protein [Verrucomicrobiae bacterium]